MSLLPFVAINSSVIHKKPFVGIAIYLAQIGFMLYWGYYAFQLEFFGVNHFEILNNINCGFFVINIVSMIIVSRSHQLTVTHEIVAEIKDGKITEEK